MNSELMNPGADTEPPQAPPATRKRPVPNAKRQKLCRVDLALIGGTGFHMGMKRKENKFFTTSLYKIDRLIKEKASQGEYA